MKWVLRAVIAWCGLSLALAAPRQERFNLVFVLTDDQARWGVGAYGNPDVRTPHMDRLAGDGARFLNAFTATPVCSPSRATFLTGLYGTQVGITDWIAPIGSDVGVGLPESAITWPEVLQRHGYATMLLGKWHLGEAPRFHPTRHGFDRFFGFLRGGNRPIDPVLEVNAEERQVKGSLPDLLVDQANRFLEENRDNPFALLLHFRAPHRPYSPVPEEDSAQVRALDPTVPQSPGLDVSVTKTWLREYYASIHSIDRNLGRLLDRLDSLDLATKTIVVFTSDHGYMIGHHGLHGKGNAYWMLGDEERPMRPNMFEESIRIPLIIRWPGQVRPGLQVEETVSNVDIFPSILTMLGVETPAQAKRQGMDFTPLLKDEKVAWRTDLFGQYDLHNNGLAFMRMIRTPRWKFVRHYYSNYEDELYDLEADPGETRNLYREHLARVSREPGYRDVALSEVVKDLQQRLTAWQRSIDDPLLRSAASPGPPSPQRGDRQ